MAVVGTTSVAVAAAFPPVFQLATLYPSRGGDGSLGVVLTGIDAGDGSGFTVSAAGDLNGDGIDDLVVGAVYADPGGRIDAGESYVLFGRNTAQNGNFPAIFKLSKLLPQSGGNGARGFVLYGAEALDNSGRRVSSGGDLNGDGLDDLLIGAPFADPDGLTDAGKAYVVFGRNTANVGRFPAAFELSSLEAGDGSAGFVMTGIEEQDDWGRRVGGAGDVNHDGFADMLIGAPFADPDGRSSAGESYVVFGRNAAQVGNFPAVLPLANFLPGAGGDGTGGFVLEGVDAGDRSGRAVNAVGDINDDGIDDLIIGADHAAADAGASYVVFGRDTAQAGKYPALLPLASLLPDSGGDGSAGFVLAGVASDRSGVSAIAAGDVNGDGIDDLIIGAYGASPGGRTGAGESYVVFGRDTAVAGNFSTVFDLSTLAFGDGSAGFVLNGVKMFDASGFAASGVGDVNGDGMDDLLIGAVYADPGGRSDAGESYVVFGRDTAGTGNFPAQFELVQLATGDGSTGFALRGFHDGDRSGRSVSFAGDINGDGIGDFLIGAFRASPFGQSKAGESYLVFGRAVAGPQ